MNATPDNAAEQCRRSKLLIVEALTKYLDLLNLLTQNGVATGQVLVSSTGDGWRLEHVPEEKKDTYQTYVLTRQQLVELRRSCLAESEFNPVSASASGLDKSYLEVLGGAVEELSAVLDTKLDTISFLYDPGRDGETPA